MTRQQFLRTLSTCATGFAAGRAQAQQATRQTFTYKTAGCEIRADIYGGSEGGPKPALMWIHGGALIFGNRKGIPPPFLAGLLEQAYAIVSIDYRLAPETKLPAIIDDVRDAWNWMRAQAGQLGIDRDHVASLVSMLPGG